MRAKVTHVAIRFQGEVYSLPKPNRHHDVIRLIVTTTDATHVDGDEQGFLDETGRFLTRKQALMSALYNDQILDQSKVYHEMLFSENLW